MKRIKDNARDQGILFSGHYVGDRLSKDDEVFLFEKLFNKLDISTIVKSYSPEGGSMFSPKDQLAVILFAFHKGITSSVKIAEIILYNLQFIYLAGGHIIHRRTINDFRLKHIESIRKIFESSVDLAIESGLVRMNDIFALDGSKIEANASFSMTRQKGEWEERQKLIVEHVAKFLRDWEEQDNLEENLEKEKKERFDRINEKLDKIKEQNKKEKSDSPEETVEKDDKAENKLEKKKTEKTSQAKEESSAIARKNRVKVNNAESAEELLDEYVKIGSLLEQFEESNEEMYISITDPDCRIMKSDSITKECYNAQVISNNQVIVAIDVTQDENDQDQLKSMTEQLKKNIGIEEKIILTADAGYNKGSNLAYIDNEELIDPFISMYDRSEKNNPERNEFHKENFTFDEEDESWTCPSGERLGFIKEFNRDDKKYTRYGCDLKKCVFCKLNKSCIKTKADIKRGYRTIEDDGYVIYRKEMRAKLQKEESKKIYSQRAGIVEPVFGQIKNNRDFTRFKLQGLRKVKGEFTIMAVAHNLGKLMKQLRREAQMA